MVRYVPPLRRRKMRHTFSALWHNKSWVRGESVSGEGSDLHNTMVVRRELPGIIRELGVRTMLDVPCGDLTWMSQLALPVEKYIGADVVPEIIARNRESFSRSDRRFEVLDITSSRLPGVDLIFCRDCLVHLSYADIWAAFRQFKESRSTYLLTTTFPDRQANYDIATGEWRPLNLQQAPFKLNAPVALVNEEYRAEGGRYIDKSLGLWSLDSIRAC